MCCAVLCARTGQDIIPYTVQLLLRSSSGGVGQPNYESNTAVAKYFDAIPALPVLRGGTEDTCEHGFKVAYGKTSAT